MADKSELERPLEGEELAAWLRDKCLYEMSGRDCTLEDPPRNAYRMTVVTLWVKGKMCRFVIEGDLRSVEFRGAIVDAFLSGHGPLGLEWFPRGTVNWTVAQ